VKVVGDRQRLLNPIKYPVAALCMTVFLAIISAHAVSEGVSAPHDDEFVFVWRVRDKSYPYALLSYASFSTHHIHVFLF
jgi:hypothetical protein